MRIKGTAFFTAIVLLLLLALPAFAFQGFTLNMPIYYQGDYTDVQVVWNGSPKSVSTSGCGAACTAMVIGYYNSLLYGDEKESPDPAEIFQQEIDNGDFRGNGLGHTSLRKVLKRYGIECKWRKLDSQSIISILSDGRPIIAHMGSGYFTDSGHYIVLRGLTDDKEVIVADPNSPDKTENYTYRLAAIVEQGYGDYPFLVCYTPAMP